MTAKTQTLWYAHTRARKCEAKNLDIAVGERFWTLAKCLPSNKDFNSPLKLFSTLQKEVEKGVDKLRKSYGKTMDNYSQEK